MDAVVVTGAAGALGKAVLAELRDREVIALGRGGSALEEIGAQPGVHAIPVQLSDRAAVQQAGGLADVAAVSVGGQQHGMVCLDETGEVVRPALLWNDVRSAGAAAELIAERSASSSPLTSIRSA